MIDPQSDLNDLVRAYVTKCPSMWSTADLCWQCSDCGARLDDLNEAWDEHTEDCRWDALRRAVAKLDGEVPDGS